MGQCCLRPPPPLGDDSILSIIRGTRPSAQALGDARIMHHVKLWDEYYVASPPEVLGTGMNGPVLKIYSKRSPSVVYALKEIRKPDSKSRDPRKTAFLFNELLIYLEVDHCNIAKIFEVYESSTSVFLVTELCAGGELFGRLRDVRRFNEIEAALLAAQILRAVNYLNNLGIVHGDIKLENFLFSKNSPIFANSLKLIDFGFSHHGAQADGGICGSPLYIAPEVVDHKESIKSDMWSVGVIVYMLLTGVAPFQGSNFSDIQVSVNSLNTDTLVRDMEPKVSEDGKDFICQCLQRDVEKRMTAKQALNHRWIASVTRGKTQTSTSNLEACLKWIVGFSKIGPLRRASIGLIAMHGPPVLTLPYCEAVFNSIDTHCDGYIQKSELADCFTKCEMADVDIDTLFACIDVRGDGRVNFSEFFAATDVFASLSQPTPPPTYSALIDSVFRKLDVDNSGFISEQNLVSLFGRRGYQGSDAAELIDEGDFVGDGVISAGEFFTLVTGYSDATHPSTVAATGSPIHATIP